MLPYTRFYRLSICKNFFFLYEKYHEFKTTRKYTVVRITTLSRLNNFTVRRHTNSTTIIRRRVPTEKYGTLVVIYLHNKWRDRIHQRKKMHIHRIRCRRVNSFHRWKGRESCNDLVVTYWWELHISPVIYLIQTTANDRSNIMYQTHTDFEKRTSRLGALDARFAACFLCGVSRRVATVSAMAYKNYITVDFKARNHAAFGMRYFPL